MTRSVLQSRGNAEVGMAVTLLTGVDRLSMDAVAFSLVDSCPSGCSITYDVRRDDDAESGLDVVWRMDEPMEGGAMFGTSDSFALQDCCLSCEVKHHAARLLESVAGRVDSVLISLPIGVEATPVAQYLDDLFRLDDWGEGSGRVRGAFLRRRPAVPVRRRRRRFPVRRALHRRGGLPSDPRGVACAGAAGGRQRVPGPSRRRAWRMRMPRHHPRHRQARRGGA